MAQTAVAAVFRFRLVGWSRWLASAAGVLVLWRIGADEDLRWIIWVLVALPVVLLSMTRWPYGALLALVGMSAMPRFFVEVFGWKARPEHLAATIVCTVAVVWSCLHKRPIQLTKLDYWVVAYVAINYVSSFFGSSEPSSTMKWALQNNLAVLPYFLIRFMIQDIKTLQNAYRILLGIGIIESVYGIICYASHHVFGTTAGMEIGQYLVDVAAPYGTLYEPNLFGAYSGCCAVLFLALYLVDNDSLFCLLGFLIASLAAILSFSRATLVALITVVFWLLWKSRLSRSGTSRKWKVLVLGLGTILVVIFAAGTGVLQQRFSALYYQGLTEGTAIARFMVLQAALQEIPKHPILGSGTASFNLSFDWGQYIPEWSSEKTWIGNAPIRILHDCGILGLTAFVGFLVSAWWKIRLVWPERRHSAGMALGLLAGTLLFAIVFQSTDGSILAFSWVHFGFFASAVVLMSDLGKPNKDGSPPNRETTTCLGD
jgi:O-antigen ligase